MVLDSIQVLMAYIEALAQEFQSCFDIITELRFERLGTRWPFLYCFFLLLLHPYCLELQLVIAFIGVFCCFFFFKYMRIFQCFHFQGSVIQNLAVVSCRFSVSDSKVLVIRRPGIDRAGQVRSNPTTSAQCRFRSPDLYIQSQTLYRLSYLAPLLLLVTQ